MGSKVRFAVNALVMASAHACTGLGKHITALVMVSEHQYPWLSHDVGAFIGSTCKRHVSCNLTKHVEHCRVTGWGMREWGVRDERWA